MRQSSDADIRALAGGELRACWVSAGWSDGLLVDERLGWPDGADTAPDTPGLAAVLVARYAGRDKVTACGYLIDLYCLGVKDVIGPRVLNDQQHAQFTRTFFAGYRQPPIAAPLELAQQLVLGAARYARSLGFDPAPGFDAVRGHLGEWSGVRAITFGRNGRPEYIQGPYDNAVQVQDTLRGRTGGPPADRPDGPYPARPPGRSRAGGNHAGCPGGTGCAGGTERPGGRADRTRRRLGRRRTIRLLRRRTVSVAGLLCSMAASPARPTRSAPNRPAPPSPDRSAPNHPAPPSPDGFRRRPPVLDGGLASSAD